jgi:ABC-2 type transport system permease protein
LLSGYLGLILLCAAFVAIGVAISSLFSNQIAAFATTLGVLILFWWIIGPIAQTAGPAGGASELINYLNFSEHFYGTLVEGIIDLRNIAFYLSMTALGLFLGTMSVEVRRWR